MADTDSRALTDADILPAEAGSDLRAADPVKTTGDATQALKDGAGKVQQQAGERLRAFADTGKERAGSALDDVSRMLVEAADQVDAKLGAQYGQYARSAADQVQGLADTVRTKDLDALLDDARGFVRASPAAAVGIAAAIGFAAARLVQAGVDADGPKRA